MGDDLIPPADVARVALDALTLRARLGRGGTAGAVAVAEALVDRSPLPVTRARRILAALEGLRAGSTPVWDLPSAPTNAYVRFVLLGGDPALRWLTAALRHNQSDIKAYEISGEVTPGMESIIFAARSAGLDTVARGPTPVEAEVAETNTALAAASTELGRIYETTAARVTGWATQTVDRAIRAAGARTLDEVRHKARRAALGGLDAQEATAAALAALPPGERLSAVPEPIQAAVEASIEARVTRLISETAVGSLEAILDAFHNRQVTTFAKLADIPITEAGRLFGVSVPTSNAMAVGQQRLVDLVLGRVDPGDFLVGQVDAAAGLVPGSISNDVLLIAGGADIDDAGVVVRDGFGRAVARDGGIADGGVGTFRTRLVDYAARISVRDSAVERITARLDIETGRVGAPSQTERDELLAELRALSEQTPGRAGLGAGQITGEAGRWVHGGSAFPFDPHLALDGESWRDLGGRQIVCANTSGAWPYNPIFYPGDHLGCSCFVEPQLQMEVAA